MRTRQICSMVCLLVLPAVPAGAMQVQTSSPAQPYIGGVSSHFGVPMREVELLAIDRLSRDELPVLLRLARASGISPSALLAYRGSGASWISIAHRNELGASLFHIAISDDQVDDSVARVHRLYGQTPRSDWDALQLTDEEVVTLANVALISRVLDVTPGEVLRAKREAGSYAEAFGRLHAER